MTNLDSPLAGVAPAAPAARAAEPLAPDAVAEVQRQFLVAETVTPGRPPHLQHCVCLLPDDVDPARLRRAMGLLDDIHEAMRTSFRRGADWHAYTRHVAPRGGLPLGERACAEDAATLLHQIRHEDRLDELHPPIPAFDGAPLARATLLRSADGRRLLVLSVHHLIFDGVSAAVYCRQLVTLYVADDPLREAQALRAQTASYGDFLHVQHEQLFGGGRPALHAYWRDYLRDLRLDPTPVSPEALAAPPTCRETFLLDAATTARIAAFAAQHALTTHLVLMACLQWAVHAHRGDEDVLTLTPTKNRPREFAQTLGCFMNPVVVRQRIDRDARLIDALAGLRGGAAGAYRHAALPIGHVVRELFPSLLAAKVPLWRSWFGIQVPSVDFRVPTGVRFALYNLPQGRTAGKGVSLEMVAEGNALHGVFLANASVPDAPALLATFRRLVECVLARPEATLAGTLGAGR